MTELLDVPELTKEELTSATRVELQRAEQALSTGDIDTEDFISLHSQFESLAANTDLFQSQDAHEIRNSNQLIDRYVRLTREFVTTNPAGGDLLASDTEDTRNAFRIYLAVESAITGDFETARGMLIDVDGTEELPLETVLLSRLEEAELENSITNERITPEESTSNMERAGIRRNEETIEKAEQADLHITIGTTIPVLKEVFEPGGRYMTTSEIMILSGGSDYDDSASRRGVTNSGYNDNRYRSEQALSHSSNPFMPKVVYGALTSELQADRASGYGRVTIHLKSEVTQDPNTVFTIGDSLPPDRGRLRASEARAQQVTAEDALVAYASKIDSESSNQRDGLADGGNYIEAHVRGLDFDKIERISITLDRGKDFSKNAEVIDECIERGIPTEVLIDPRKWSIELRVKERIESGMNEEEAVQETIKRLRSNFKSIQNPLLSIVFVVPVETNEHGTDNYREWHGYLNDALFEQNGITVRRPIVGTRLLQTARQS